MAARDFVHGLQGRLAAAMLLALCVTPALGSVGTLITAIAMLLALPVAVARRGWSEVGAKRWVWGICLIYFSYFVLVDALLRGDIGASLYTMTPNLPLVGAALVAMALDPARAMLAPRRIGQWASGAVLLSFGMALLIWIQQPSWQILGLSLTEATGVNGRLMLLAGNPLPFAATYMTLGFVALLGWHDRGLASRGVALAALVTALATVSLWAQSRGATLASLPLLAVAIWYLRPRPMQLLAGVLGMTALAGIAIIAGDYGDKLNGFVRHLTTGISVFTTGDVTAEGSTGQRLVMYSAGLAAFADSPIWGYGISQRFAAVIPYLPDGMTIRYSHLHNSFLTHAVAGGVIGVGVLLTMLLTPFAINRTPSPPLARADRDLHYSAGVIFLSLAGIGMTNLILNHDVSANFLGTLLVMHLLIHHHRMNAGTR
jgi:hypothetical protein